MRDSAQHPTALAAFEFSSEALGAGDSGTISDAALAAPPVLPAPPDLFCRGFAALGRTAFLKLNGGLGTTMRLSAPKSSLPVSGEMNFLQVVLRQTELLRQVSGFRLPLILMDSLWSESWTRNAVSVLGPEARPLIVVQASFPRIDLDSLHPVDWPESRRLEWNPSGHGDVVRLLVTGGTVEDLLRAGFDYLFVANIDNLGGIPSAAGAAYFEDSGWDLMAEVVPRTPLDVKGGHPALRLSDGRLIIRETAQVPNPSRPVLPSAFRLHNTGNFWLRLESIRDAWRRWRPVFPFPALQTAKEIHLADGTRRSFRQVEVSLGGGFDFFDRTGLLTVNRQRFIPVKSQADLERVRAAPLWIDRLGHPRGYPAW